MLIFEFKWKTGATDWVFAPDLEEAKDFYISHTECGDLEGCTVTEVPEEKWGEMYIIDPNEITPDEEFNEDDYICGYKIQ